MAPRHPRVRRNLAGVRKLRLSHRRQQQEEGGELFSSKSHGRSASDYHEAEQSHRAKRPQLQLPGSLSGYGRGEDEDPPIYGGDDDDDIGRRFDIEASVELPVGHDLPDLQFTEHSEQYDDLQRLDDGGDIPTELPFGHDLPDQGCGKSNR